MDVTQKLSKERGNLRLNPNARVRLESTATNGLHAFVNLGQDIRGPIHLLRVSRDLKRAERFYPDLIPQSQMHAVPRMDEIVSVYFTIPPHARFRDIYLVVKTVQNGKLIRYKGKAWDHNSSAWKRFLNLYWFECTTQEASTSMSLAKQKDLVRQTV